MSEGNSEAGNQISVRWVLIISVSAAVGVGVGLAEGVGAGVMAGFAAAGFLLLAVGS